MKMAKRTSRPATALLVDMRDFTPTYNHHTRNGAEARFAEFIEAFYACCSDACRDSYSKDPGDRLYLNCTGDGVLAVFLGSAGERTPDHVFRAYLAALRLQRLLPPVFRILGEPVAPWERPRFGMGLETGSVITVSGGTSPHRLDACLGHCINVAARLEGITKVIAATPLVVGDAANRELVRGLCDGADYTQLRKLALDSSLASGDARGALGKLREANDTLGVLWIGSLILKGVEKPLPAVRSSPAALQVASKALEARLGEILGLRDGRARRRARGA